MGANVATIWTVSNMSNSDLVYKKAELSQREPRDATVNFDRPTWGLALPSSCIASSDKFC